MQLAEHNAAQLLDTLLTEAEMVFAVSIVAIAKEMHSATGKASGEFKCPRCCCGVVRWSVASNGHAAVLCSTTHEGDDGRTFRCTSARE